MATLDKSQKIGITETSDPSFHLELFDNLYSGNIIVTKRLTDKLIEKLVENKDKCILHMTCTGFGGTVLEPFVPKYEITYKYLGKLIESGFPVSHIVLRVDPVVPTDKGINVMKNVIERFGDLGITRVRFSVLDMYEHVKERFREKGFPLPYDTFHAPLDIRLKIRDILLEYGEKYGFVVEACGEPGIESCSCLSQKDIDILGLSDSITLVGNKEQRKHCGCPQNKTQLIREKPSQCANNCVYCFWKP